MSNFYRLEVSPGGRRKYIQEREYLRPADGIVLVKTEPGCKSTSVVVLGGVKIQPLAELVSRDALAAAVVQLYDELVAALCATQQPMTPADRGRAIITHMLEQLKAHETQP